MLQLKKNNQLVKTCWFVCSSLLLWRLSCTHWLTWGGCCVLESCSTRLLWPACVSMHSFFRLIFFNDDLRPAQKGAAKHHLTPGGRGHESGVHAGMVLGFFLFVLFWGFFLLFWGWPRSGAVSAEHPSITDRERTAAKSDRKRIRNTDECIVIWSRCHQWWKEKQVHLCFSFTALNQWKYTKLQSWTPTFCHQARLGYQQC